MTDRELLEAAAKAANYLVSTSPYTPGQLFMREGEGNHEWRAWDPLTDDGDALRLAAKLAIDIKFHFEDGGFVEAWCSTREDWVCAQDMGQTLAECARRAIVHAAAAMSEQS